MSEFPFGFEKIAPATWAYLSALLVLTLFFKFNRFWSFRNLDLALIILISPGLIMVIRSEAELNRIRAEMKRTEVVSKPIESQPRPDALEANSETNTSDEPQIPLPEMNMLRAARWGYIWLFSVGVVLLIRLLLDPLLVRRPMLEPNLSIGGLTFLVCSHLIFIVAHILQSNPQPEELAGSREAIEMMQGKASEVTYDLKHYGPGLGVFHLIPVFPTFFVVEGTSGSLHGADPDVEAIVIAKITAILLQLVIVIGFVVVGNRQFGDAQIGWGMATLHLLLPYTAQFAGHVLHILPAALLIWAIAMYRRPVIAGILIGAVAGVSYYPLFLLPLWLSFYWERGALRFALGVVGSILAIVLALFFVVPSWSDFWIQMRSMFGFWWPKVEDLIGIWQTGMGWDAWYRLPILVGFIGLSLSFIFWPARKNLGVLIAYSAAIMVAVQFWHGHVYGGGLLIAWYMPLLLMTIFRPNLDEITATS